jgi:hypothetical protein
MPDSLISNHSAYLASLRCCPPSPDQLSVMTGMRIDAGIVIHVAFRYEFGKTVRVVATHDVGKYVG